MSLADLPLVKLDNFEGPFDLLIELARSEKVDLTTVSLARITDAYLQYLQETELPPSTQADFLMVAATLLLLKLNQLSPQLAPEEVEEVATLTDRVRIYQHYRQAALQLKQAWNANVLLPAPAYLQLHHHPPFPALNPDSLARALHHVVATIKPPANPKRHLRPRGRSLHDCLTLLRHRLTQITTFNFQDALKNELRDTVAVSFLATLELAQNQELRLTQTEAFGPLKIQAPSTTPR